MREPKKATVATSACARQNAPRPAVPVGVRVSADVGLRAQWFWVGCWALVASACGARAVEPPPPPAPKALLESDVKITPAPVPPAPEGAPGPAPSSEAARILGGLRARLGEAGAGDLGVARTLPAGLATSYRRVSGGLRPQFSSTERLDARVLLSTSARGAFRLEDVGSGLDVEVTLDGSSDVDARLADGYVVYPRAHRTGASLLHRALPSGLEDYISFESKPARASVSYGLKSGTGVNGLRLVENTLELLDAGGAPRLRVEPPYIVGADGARTDAKLAVEGCDVDTNPAAPWGRVVTPPRAARCTLRVTWDGDAVAYPAVLDPRWTSTTTTMVAKRQGHTATLLAGTGTFAGKVLVAGGTDGTMALATAELFDRTTKSWAATGPMPTGRQQHAAVRLPTGSNATTSGKVLVTGGGTGVTAASGSSLNTTALYDPAAGTWTTAAPMVNGTTAVLRHLHTATLLANGQVLVAGGMSGTAVINTAGVYNPASGIGAWTATTAMSLGVRFHTATLLTGAGTLNGKVLVVGGNTGGTTNTAVVQLFTFGANPNWTSTGAAQLTMGREGHTATLLANGQVLVTGGKSGATPVATTFVFNPAVSPTTWTSAGTMNATHTGHTATLLSTSVLASGQVLVAGGAPTTTSSAELWNGTTTWTATTALSTVISGHTATLLADGTVLLAGGVTGTTPLTTAQLYDPSWALGCTGNSQCATGFCTNGVCCDTACNGGCGACNLAGKVGTCSPVAVNTACADDGNACTTDKCDGTTLTCQHAAGNAGTSCRNAANECDVAETCTGTSTTCPTDVVKSNTTACTDDLNPCTTDKCNGTAGAPACVHAAGNAGTSCRNAANECDVAETCTGTSTTCPTDVVKSNATACTDDLNPCTTDKCNGTAGAPACVHAAGNAGTSCRNAANECDVAETCTGTSTTCPTDVVKSNTTACTDDLNPCTTDKCNGTAGAPACVHAAGNAGTTCRNANGACDVAETCTGTSTACPADGFAPPTTSCRLSTGQCDAQENCTGTSAACPPDVSKPNGTTCDDGQKCTTADACSNGTCQGTNVVCTGDQCHLSGSCNPTTGACFNPEKLNGTTCDDGNPATSGEVCEAGSCRTSTSYQQASAFFPDDLGSLGGAVTNPLGINDAGQIVGNATTADGLNNAFVWNPAGPMQNLSAALGLLPGSIANDINDAGVVVGTRIEPNGAHQAFRYVWNGMAIGGSGAAGSSGGGGSSSGGGGGSSSGGGGGSSSGGGGGSSSGGGGGSSSGGGGGSSSGGSGGSSSPGYEDVGVISDDQPDQFGDRGSYAVAVNAEGDITGTFAGGGDVHTFRYTRATGSLFDIGGLYGKQTIPYGMSDAGTIVGVSWVPNALTGGIRALGHGFINDAVSPQPADINQYVDPASGWTLVNARSISPNGTYIVGSGDLGGQLRGYRLNRTTGVVDELSTGWSGDVFPYSVNNSGQVVGTGFPTSSSSLTAWFYSDQVGFQRLDSMVSATAGWTFSTAVAINGSGTVSGYGTYQGQTRSYSLKLGTSCPTSCTASDQCHLASCDPGTGACIQLAKRNGTTCDDSNTATNDETCQVGACRSPSSYPPISNLAVADIGELGGGSSSANGINSFGDVVGDSAIAGGQTHAFDWGTSGPIIDVAAQPGFLANSGAASVNDFGTIAGATWDGSGDYHVYRLDINGVEDLGAGGDNSVAVDVFNYRGASASAMNATGQLTGWFTQNHVIHGFRYSDGAGYQDVGSLAGGETQGFGISDAGVVVGSSWVPGSPSPPNDFTSRRLGHAILWDGIAGKPVDLSLNVNPTSGITLHTAAGISPNGRYIVGDGERNGVLIAYRLDTVSGNLDEVSPGWPGDAYGNAVNDNGDVVGMVHPDAANQIQAGFVYTDQIGFKKLNDIIGPTSGWDLQAANALNSKGEIVGWGRFQNEYRAFRLHVVTPQIACLGKQDGDLCDAGDNPCTQTATCQAGLCAGIQKQCLASDGCHSAGTCDPATGVCSNPLAAGGSCSILPPGTPGGPGGPPLPPGSPPPPTVTVPPDGKSCSQPTAMNKLGEVVGFSSDCGSPSWPDTQTAAPFTVMNGTTQALPTPTGLTSMIPTAVGDGGDIVANAYDATTGARSVYLYPAANPVPDLLPLPGAGATAWAIRTTQGDGALTVLGSGATGTAPNPWEWETYALPAPGGTGQVQSFPPVAGLEGDGVVLGTNLFGAMVGYYTLPSGVPTAVVWSWGLGMKTLNELAAEQLLAIDMRVASAINDNGDIVGFGKLGDAQIAFKMNLYTTFVTELLPLPAAELFNTPFNATAINNNGVIVGTAGQIVDDVGHLSPERAFVQTDATSTIDLNDVFSLAPGWVLASAVGVNDNGLVAGIALNQETGERRPYVLTLPDLTAAECIHRADGTPCNDGNVCTRSAQCNAGACVRTEAVTCVASDSCHSAGVCDPGAGGCTNPALADGTACDDHDGCTRGDACLTGLCAPGPTMVCPTLPCAVGGTCDHSNGACVYSVVADGTACDDANACTQSDACQTGQCVGTNPVTCPAAPNCETGGICDPMTGTCAYSYVADGTACNDGDSCSTGASCRVGICTSQGFDPTCPVSYSQANPSLPVPDFPPAPAGLQGVYGDTTDDLRSDIFLLGNRVTGALPIVESLEGGQFEPLAAQADVPAFSQYPGAKTVLGDFDGDGRTDMATVGAFGQPEIDVAFSNGDGTFRTTKQNDPIITRYATAPGVKVIATDLNHDGRTDLAFLGAKGVDSVGLAFSEGADGTFFTIEQSFPELARQAAEPGVKPVACKGRIFLVGGANWTNIPVFGNEMTNALGIRDISSLYAPLLDVPISQFHAYAHRSTTKALAGDFDGDGSCDIALVGSYATDHLPVALGVAGLGRTSWEFPTVSIDHSSFMRNPGTTAVTGDYDGDGTTDIAFVGGAGRTSIAVAHGNRVVGPRECPPQTLCIPGQFSFSLVDMASPAAALAVLPGVRALSNVDQHHQPSLVLPSTRTEIAARTSYSPAPSIRQRCPSRPLKEMAYSRSAENPPPVLLLSQRTPVSSCSQATSMEMAVGTWCSSIPRTGPRASLSRMQTARFR